MKIAIDLRPLQIGHENRGIGAYLINILHYLPTDDSTHFIFLRYNTSNPLQDFNLPIPISYQEITYKRCTFGKQPAQLIKFLLDQMSPKYIKLLLHRPNIFFQTDYLLGAPRILGTKVITVCYDLIPFKFQSMYNTGWRHYWRMRHFSLKARIVMSLRAVYYSSKYRSASRLLKRSSKVLSISKTTKKDLVQLMHLKPSKIRVIYLAPSLRESTPSKSIVALTDKIAVPYLLFIGGTDRRRQVYELVSAYNKLRAKGLQCALVLAGNEFTDNSTRLDRRTAEAIRLSSYKDGIYLTGSVSEGDKYWLLDKATCFVYPSIYEGFGMPVLEALMLGTPVVAYRSEAVEEVASDSVVYTSSFSSDAIVESAKDIIMNPVKNTSIPEIVSKYSWIRTAELTWGEIINQ